MHQNQCVTRFVKILMNKKTNLIWKLVQPRVFVYIVKLSKK